MSSHGERAEAPVKPQNREIMGGGGGGAAITATNHTSFSECEDFT